MATALVPSNCLIYLIATVTVKWPDGGIVKRRSRKTTVCLGLSGLIALAVICTGLVRAYGHFIAAEVGPRLVVVEPHVDLGLVSQSTTGREVAFSIRNDGTAMLRITSVGVSCGCMRPKLDCANLKPSQVATLRVWIPTPRGAGRVEKNVVLNTSDPKYPRTLLTVSAVVEADPLISPDEIKVSELPSCGEVKARITISGPPGDNAFAILGLTPPIPSNVTLDSATHLTPPIGSERAVWQLDFKISSRNSPSWEDDVLINIQDHKGTRRVRVPVYVQEQSPIEWQPRTITLERADLRWALAARKVIHIHCRGQVSRVEFPGLLQTSSSWTQRQKGIDRLDLEVKLYPLGASIISDHDRGSIYVTLSDGRSIILPIISHCYAAEAVN